jgi:hypothetical protein
MASRQDWLLLSQAVKDVPYGTTPAAPNGWSVIRTEYQASGMMATAFKSNGGSEIVIGYQATNQKSGSSAWFDAQLAADKQIAIGVNPQAYTDALNFAFSVRDANPGTQISVTGFSLGGGESQFVASITGFAGASFGGPGIAGYTYNPINANFESYVNYGDLIAMWGGTHVGRVLFIGNPLFATPELLLSPVGSAIVTDYAHDLSVYANNINGPGGPEIPANVYFPAEFGVGTLFGSSAGYPKFGGDLNTQFSFLPDGTLVTSFYAADGTLIGNRTTGTDGNRSVSLFATSGQSWISETGFLNSKGQLNSINVQQANGGVASTALDINNTQSWSSKTLIVDLDGNVRSERELLDSLGEQLKEFDTGSAHAWKELDITKDPTGKVAAAQVTLDPNILAAGMSIGQIFGSALGGALGGNSLVGNLAGSTIGGLIGQKFVQVLATSMTADLSTISLNDVFAGQGISVANAGIGAISSFLTAELGHALHIGGFDGQLFNTAVSGFTTSLLIQVTDKMARGSLDFAGAIAAIDWTQAVSGAIDAAQINLGNLLGGYLGHELVPAQTREGAIGGQLFGAIGGFILPGGLGSLIGTIIGTLIFNHFGTQPSPGAVDLLDQAGYFYGHSQYQSSDGGGYGVSNTMAQAADDIVNAYLHAVNGAALDHSKQVTLGYIKNPDLLFISGTPGHSDHSFTSADDAVHAAALDVLQNLEVIGGDLLMKRAHQSSISRLHPDRNRRVKARESVRGAGWRRAQPASASMPCISQKVRLIGHPIHKRAILKITCISRMT